MFTRLFTYYMYGSLVKVQCPLEVVNLRPSRDVAVLDFSYKFGTNAVHTYIIFILSLLPIYEELVGTYYSRLCSFMLFR